jgi:hypothetical protein
MIPTPEPQETPAPTAWDVTQDFVRTAKKVDQLRR